MEVVAAKNIFWFFYFAALTLDGVICGTFYGKLVLKISVASKKDSVFAHRPTVFATRRSTYLKKDGDVFQIHIPGIARNGTADTISFESVRFPGYFLRHKKVEEDYKFRIAKSTPDDKYFNSEATFKIQRHSGIEGSGMLRLFEDPSYYLCVRKYNFADSALKAMKNDNTEDFRARCSFFIQKLKPENVNDAVKKSTQNDKQKQTNNEVNNKQLNNRNVLSSGLVPQPISRIPAARKTQVNRKLTAVQFNSKISPKHFAVSKSQANVKAHVAPKPHVITHKTIGEPSEKYVNAMLNDYVKKIQTNPDYVETLAADAGTQQNNAMLQNNLPTASMWDWNARDKLISQNVNFYPQEGQYDVTMKSMYPQNSNQASQSQNFIYPGTSMLSYFPVVSKYDPTKQYIKTFFQENDEHLPNTETNHPIEVGTSSINNEIKPDVKNKIHNPRDPKQFLTENHSERFKVTPILSSSRTHEKNQWNTNKTVKEKPSGSHMILKDTKYTKQRKQEPSLNIDGVVRNATVTATRSHRPAASNTAHFHKQTGHHGAWRRKNSDSLATKDIRFKTKTASLRKVGPNKPLNLHDFGKSTHREPSLNLDGLITRVTLPSTRSNISINGMLKPNTAAVNKFDKNNDTKGHPSAPQTNTTPHETARAINNDTDDNSLQKVTKLNEDTEVHETNKAETSKNKNSEVLGFSKIEEAADILDSADTKKGKIEASTLSTSNQLNTQAIIVPLKNTTQPDAVRSVLENPSPDNKEGQTKKAEKQVLAAKKEHFVDETIKNFTTDAGDLDLKIFGDEKTNETGDDKPSDVRNASATSTSNDNSDNSTSQSAFPEVKANSSDPIEKILYTAMTDDPTLKNINLTQPDDGGLTFMDTIKESEKPVEKHSNNDTTRNTVFDSGNTSSQLDKFVAAPSLFLLGINKTSNATLNSKKSSNKTAAVTEDELRTVKNKTTYDKSSSVANKTSQSERAPVVEDKVPLIKEKASKTNTSAENSTITSRNATASVLEAHKMKESLNNATAINDSISTVSIAANETKKIKEHAAFKEGKAEKEIKENAASKEGKTEKEIEDVKGMRNDKKGKEIKDVKEVKLISNDEHEGEHEGESAGEHEGVSGNMTMEQSSSQNNSDDNIPFEDASSNDMTTDSSSPETGSENMESVTDNNEGALASILNQRADGIEYDNMDKATTFKDLGSSEMKGIAKAMSSLNIQDVDHLKSRMKTLDMLDRNPPNHFQHLKKAEGNDYVNEGLHTNGFSIGDPTSNNHVQSYTAEDKEVEGSPGALHEDNYSKMLGGHLPNQQSSSSFVNDNAIQENGDIHETESTLQDPALQEASSVPVTISSSAPEASTNAQENIDSAQQISAPSQQEFASSQNGGQSSLETGPIGGNGLQVDASNAENVISAGNSMSAQRTDENPEASTFGTQSSEASGLTMAASSSGETTGTQGSDVSAFAPQRENQMESGVAEGEVDNTNGQQSALMSPSDIDARSRLLKKHAHAHAETHPHPQKNVVVKGVAKNTVLKVPIAISYTKVTEEDNSGHRKLEHLIKDVIHDVKNELHGGGPEYMDENSHNIFHHATLASNDILPHFTHIAEERGPVVGSPHVEHHPVTLYETEHYEPAKSSSDVSTPDAFQERPVMHHEVNVVRHTHHVVTVKDDAEKQKMVNGLVDYQSDRCVSLQLINDLPSRYRLISSINKHGYTPRGAVFTLKTVFKDPSAHKYVSFHAIDESEPGRQVTLDGAKELISVPTPCLNKPKIVHVSGVKAKPPVVAKKDVLPEPDIITDSRTDEDEEVYKKNRITYPQKNRITYPLQEHHIVHNVNGKQRRQRVTHIYLRKTKKNRISYPREVRRFNVLREPATPQCIRTYGGTTHSFVECCHIPFIYNGELRNTCISDVQGAPSWCSLNEDFDRHRRWGLCMPPTIPDPGESDYRAPIY